MDRSEVEARIVEWRSQGFDVSEILAEFSRVEHEEQQTALRLHHQACICLTVVGSSIGLAISLLVSPTIISGVIGVILGGSVVGIISVLDKPKNLRI